MFWLDQWSVTSHQKAMIKYIYCALVSCYTYLQHCMNAHRLTPVSLLIQVCVIFSDMKSFKEVIPCTVGNHCLTLRTSVGETSSGSTPAKSSTPATSTVKFPAAIKSGSAVTSPGGFSCTAPTESESDVTMTLVAFDWVSPIDNMLEIPSIVSKISYNCIIISKIESRKSYRKCDIFKSGMSMARKHLQMCSILYLLNICSLLKCRYLFCN